MLSQEDNRRLAQLERQLRRDDPDFCARMTSGRVRTSVPLVLVFVAVVVWTTALVFGVLGWWIVAAVAALCATIVVVSIAYLARPHRHRGFSGPVPPAG
jgi:hypothetical protein